MPFCLIGLGSNVGDREATLALALERLQGRGAIRVVRCSAWRETAPVGGPAGQSPYLNGAALLETELPPEALLGVLQEIERELGRKREGRWSARTLDLDLLLYGQLVLKSASLELPHPRMALRRFVLEPAAEIAPEMLHPTTGWTLQRLFAHLCQSLPYVAIAGPIGSGKTELARGLAAAGATLVLESLDHARLSGFYADPASQAWRTELEFLSQRVGLLGADAPFWANRTDWVASDFWFDQSPAFARAWLPPERYPHFHAAWENARREVVRPRFVALLDAPSEELHRRIAQRGRPYERGIGVERLERIREEILAQIAQENTGPVLRLENVSRQEALDETLAAMQAMQ